jgi:CxxC motif-containing protein (DUF1111 family)
LLVAAAVWHSRNKGIFKGVQRDGVGSFFVENSGCDVLHVGDGDGFGDEENDTDEVALIFP